MNLRNSAGESATESRERLRRAAHGTLRVVTREYESFKFNTMVAHVIELANTYRDRGGEPADGLPMLADGARAVRLTDAVLESAANRSWVEVPAP